MTEDDHLVEGNVEIDSVDLVEFNFGDKSIVFNPADKTSWLEHDTDELDDIDIEGPGIDAKETVVRLPPLLREDGSTMPLTLEEFMQLRAQSF
jgi:hypothetical protein